MCPPQPYSPSVDHSKDSVIKVVYKEKFGVGPGMCTERSTISMATDWQKLTAVRCVVQAIREQNSTAVWAALGKTLQDSYGSRDECVRAHAWTKSRGQCLAAEVDSFQVDKVVVGSVFNTRGVREIVHKDTFWLSSCLVVGHSTQCLFSREQGMQLVSNIVLAAAVGQMPTPNNCITDDYNGDQELITTARGWIYSISSASLRNKLDEKQSHSSGLQLCSHLMDWPSRSRGTPGSLPGFRGFKFLSSARSHGRADAWDVKVAHTWDCGVTHLLTMVDHFVVAAGCLDAFARLDSEDTGAWPYNRLCAHQYVGKYQSCMV